MSEEIKKAFEKMLFDLQYQRDYECNYYYPEKEREDYLNTLIAFFGLESDELIQEYKDFVINTIE